MTAETPLAATHPKLKIRADMWRDALAAHRAGRIKATEVRASDYIEDNGLLTFVLGQPILAGKRAYSPEPLNVKHSWTSIEDVARTLVTVATDERAWGHAWMVPTQRAADRTGTRRPVRRGQRCAEAEAELDPVPGPLDVRAVRQVRQGTAYDALPVHGAVRHRLQRDDGRRSASSRRRWTTGCARPGPRSARPTPRRDRMMIHCGGR